jgi:hypothetical protein
MESSAERIHSTTNSFNLMRQQQSQSQSQQQQYTSYPTTSTPIQLVKPAISPKPGTLDRDRKFNNSSPSYSTISEGSVGYQSSSHYQLPTTPTPPPPPRSFQQSVSHQQPLPPPPPSFKPQNGTSQLQSEYGQSHSTSSQHEDLYARPRHPDQYYSASSAASTPPATPKKTIMRPSEFYSEAQSKLSSSGGGGGSSTFVPPKGGFQVMPSGFGKTFGKDASSSYQDDFSHYDSGPIQSEQVFESRGADGSVSLQRIFRQEQSSSSSSRVVSSRKVFQQQQQETSK